MAARVFGEGRGVTTQLPAVTVFSAYNKQLQGDKCQARKPYTESLELLKGHADGEVTAYIPTTMCYLAKLCVESWGYELAGQTLKEVLAVEGKGDPPCVQMAANPPGELCKRDRGEEALENYRLAAESARQVLGDPHETTLPYMGDLMLALIAEEELTEAFELSSELLKRRRELRFEYHTETIDIKKNSALILPLLGFWPEAERMQREVLRYLDAVHPHGNNCAPLPISPAFLRNQQTRQRKSSFST